MAKLSKESDIRQSCYSQTTYSTTYKRKLQHLKQHQHNTLPQPKGPAYWDNLSKIWLTKGALKELDRRNSYLEPRQEYHRPVTRQFNAERKKRWKPRFAPDFLRDCTPSCLKQLERFSKLGGPDLSNLRNYPEPGNPLDEPMTSQERKRSALSQSTSSLPTSSKTGASKPITKKSKTGTYTPNFQQYLIDNGIYPNRFNPNGRRPALPNNWDDINKRLVQRRPSLSLLEFSQEDFGDFQQIDADAEVGDKVKEFVMPKIEGKIGDLKCVGGGYLFGNLADLTDGKLAKAKPDRFYSARPHQLNQQICQQLSDLIIPSTRNHRPIACYYGALGARAMHALQVYQQQKPIYDNNAYTITSTYADGALKLYTTHLTEPKGADCRPEYIMTQLGGWMMTNNLETSRQGASAYRNTRDWAKEKRDEFIRLANERHLNAQSQTQDSENGRSS
ncbi:hypothetical protein PHISCL_09110 [Aspergillus sclerotialis]|uniref:Uncharacterized protein n=1 Tax=Aspergillus sclerotialis TaxID=2070753 RepID=A0A3A2Z7F4_9EURO|nr:hypothetical protein PHISCL_09110 [Aspergillus sclerotialis]